MRVKEAYKILNISRFSSFDKIKAQYRSLSKKYHPDINQDTADNEKFKQIQEAYETICHKKNIYITKNANDLSKQKPDVAHRGGDIYTYADITFKEAALGCEKVIAIKRMQHCSCASDERITCPLCHGSGKQLKNSMVSIKIPRGVFDTQSIIIRGKGHIGDKGRENGDLIVNVRILPDEYYSRRGLNVYTKTHVSFYEACLGTNKTIETIYGSVMFKIPPGMEYPYTACLTCKGIIDGNTGEIGNHYVTCYISIPKHFDDEQRVALEKFKQN